MVVSSKLILVCYLVFFFQLPALSLSWAMGWSPTLTHQLMVITTVLQPLTLVAMDTCWSVIQQGFVISLGILVHGEEQTELVVVRRFSVTYTTLFNCVTWHLQLQLICWFCLLYQPHFLVCRTTFSKECLHVLMCLCLG